MKIILFLMHFLVYSAGIFLLACCLLMSGAIWVFEAIIFLVAGWAYFIHRVLSSVTIGWSGTITALLCLIGLTVGTQFFLDWLFRSGGSQQSSTVRRRWALSWTLAGLSVVVLMFVAGIACVGVFHQTGWLLNSPEPLLLHDRREARLLSAHNLNQIGVAAQKYMNPNAGRLPGLILDEQGTLLHSWQTYLLPFLQEDLLYRRIKLDRPWTHPDQGTAFQQIIGVYQQPRVGSSRLEPERVDGCAASHYAGNVHVFGQDPKPFAKMVANVGMSNVILAGEVKEGFRPWGDPRNLRDPAAGLNRSANTFGSSDPRGVTQVLMGDGSVRSFTGGTDPEFLQLLGKPQP